MAAEAAIIAKDFEVDRAVSEAAAAMVRNSVAANSTQYSDGPRIISSESPTYGFASSLTPSSSLYGYGNGYRTSNGFGPEPYGGSRLTTSAVSDPAFSTLNAFYHCPQPVSTHVIPSKTSVDKTHVKPFVSTLPQPDNYTSHVESLLRTRSYPSSTIKSLSQLSQNPNERAQYHISAFKSTPTMNNHFSESSSIQLESKSHQFSDIGAGDKILLENTSNALANSVLAEMKVMNSSLNNDGNGFCEIDDGGPLDYDSQEFEDRLQSSDAYFSH
jgi:hypothetical protein